MRVYSVLIDKVIFHVFTIELRKNRGACMYLSLNNFHFIRQSMEFINLAFAECAEGEGAFVVMSFEFF